MAAKNPDRFEFERPLWEQGMARIGGSGHPEEYILKMRRLPQDRMMDEVADRGELRQEVPMSLLPLVLADQIIQSLLVIICGQFWVE